MRLVLHRNRIAASGVILLFYLIVFQDLVGSVLFKLGLPEFLIKGIIFLKEAIVVGLGGVVLVRRNFRYLTIVLGCFVLYAGAFLAVGDTPFIYSLLGYRTYLLLFGSFLLGEQLAEVPMFLERFLKHLTRIFWFVILFSFLEYFVFPESIWRNVFPVVSMKKDVLGLAMDEFGESGLQVNAFGELARRMIGPFNDPLTLAYFGVVILDFWIASIFVSKNGSKARVVWGTILVLFTQTRAIILGMILSGIAFITHDRRIKMRYVIGSVVIFLGTSVFLVVFWPWVDAFVQSIFTTEGRNIGHLEAYVRGIETIASNPMGYGLGASSVIVSFASGNIGTENVWINLAIEIGVLGSLWLIGIMTYLYMRYRQFLNIPAMDQEKYQIVATAFLLITQFVFAGFVAPHILTAKILIPFMIVLGWAYATTYRLRGQ